ncbi:MAG: hypothetical protein LBC74_08345 [Planctomycetaceae bacterium]|jgi:hypothetical protein|nr:hypothetical protein [Planctomycetaceae bacterium]
MLRQNPVKKKRGELNIERRFLPPELKRSLPLPEVLSENFVVEPVEPTAVIELPDNKVATVSSPVTSTTVTPPATPTTATSTQTATISMPVTKNNSAINTVTKIQSDISPNGIATAMPDSDWRISQYNLPEILAYLAKIGVGDGADNRISANGFKGGVFELLNEGLRKAREFDDKLFISIFETAIRISCKGDSSGLGKETFAQLQQIYRFNECYKTANSINEKWLQAADRKLLRESRISAKFPLLMFPQPHNDSSSNSGIIKKNVGYDFFVTFNGNGILINPSCDFFDGLYQIGGVLGEVRSVVITARDKIDRGFIEQLKFYRNRQMFIEHELISGVASNLPQIQFFVPNELISELADIPNTAIIDIDSIHADGNEIMISEGVGLSFRFDQLSLSLLTEFGVRRIRFVGQTGLLRENLSGDVLVFTVDDVERFFSVIGLAKIADATITIFDISQPVFGLTRLFEPLRQYIGAAAVAGVNLVCEIGTERFLDVVKGFDSDKDVWSSYSEIDYCDDILYYFSSGVKERFTVESADIIETFLTNRRRRHGLYFVQ